MERHTLVIGGTGMLAIASIALAASTEEITLVAGSDRSLQQVSACLPAMVKAVHRLRLDWSEPGRFLSALRKHIGTVGVPTLTVAWLHDDDLGPRIAEVVGGADGPSRFVQVLGSRATDPEKAASVLRPPSSGASGFSR